MSNKGGRKKGAVGYDKEQLLKAIQKTIPTCMVWEQVTQSYFEKSNESELRTGDALKRHWNENMCKKHKKVTGEADADRFTKRCQSTHLIIESKSAQRSTNWEESASEDDSTTSLIVCGFGGGFCGI
jgi:hypothetical protein